jgi:4-coumarate--CoA ligase
VESPSEAIRWFLAFASTVFGFLGLLCNTKELGQEEFWEYRLFEPRCTPFQPWCFTLPVEHFNTHCKSATMPIQSRWSTPIDEVSLPTYIFGSPHAPLTDKPILMNASSPDQHYLTAQSYRLWCQRFAVGLRRMGLEKGDRVLLFSGNTIFFPVVIVGTIMAGGVFTGANPSYVPRELAYQLKDSGAKFLITADSSLDTALEAAKTNGMPEEHIFLFDDGIATFEGKGQSKGNVRHWTALMADEEAGRWFAWPEPTPEELKTTTVTLNYSSGTTGVPKGVEITSRNYVSNASQMEFQTRLDPDFEEKNARARLLCFL